MLASDVTDMVLFLFFFFDVFAGILRVSFSWGSYSGSLGFFFTKISLLSKKKNKQIMPWIQLEQFLVIFCLNQKSNH